MLFFNEQQIERGKEWKKTSADFSLALRSRPRLSFLKRLDARIIYLVITSAKDTVTILLLNN